MDIANHELQLANDFIKHIDSNIFLIGKAGTGKTTFLHQLKENMPKQARASITLTPFTLPSQKSQSPYKLFAYF